MLSSLFLAADAMGVLHIGAYFDDIMLSQGGQNVGSRSILHAYPTTQNIVHNISWYITNWSKEQEKQNISSMMFISIDL